MSNRVGDFDEFLRSLLGIDLDLWRWLQSNTRLITTPHDLALKIFFSPPSQMICIIVGKNKELHKNVLTIAVLRHCDALMIHEPGMNELTPNCQPWAQRLSAMQTIWADSIQASRVYRYLHFSHCFPIVWYGLSNLNIQTPNIYIYIYIYIFLYWHKSHLIKMFFRISQKQ